MSLSARIKAVVQSDLPPTERLVLMAIAYHADGATLECRLKVATLARETGMTRRGTHKVLARLQATGWLERRHVVRNGRQASSVFTLNLGPKAPAGIGNHVPYSGGRIGNHVPRIGNHVPTNREPRSDLLTCIEPVMNRAPNGAAALESAAPTARKTIPLSGVGRSRIDQPRRNQEPDEAEARRRVMKLHQTQPHLPPSDLSKITHVPIEAVQRILEACA